MKITIIGAGAIGLLLASSLEGDNDVSLLVKKNKSSKFISKGLWIEKANQRKEIKVKIVTEIEELDKKSAFITVGAKIMLDKNSPYLNSAVINKGSNAGIKLGMPVLSKGHLAGRSVEVNFLSSSAQKCKRIRKTMFYFFPHYKKSCNITFFIFNIFF